jgi:hypothetical protein
VVAGLRQGDSVTYNPGFSLTLDPAAGQYANVNTYTITPSGTVSVVKGSGGNDYRIYYANGSLTITPRILTITAAGPAITKPYDGTTALPAGVNVASIYTVGNIVNSDNVIVSAASGAAFDAKDAGSRLVLISGLNLSGSAAANYTLPSNRSIAGTITKATLTYVANTASREYGSANPAFSGTVTGFVNDESVATATTGTLVFTSTATLATNVGTRAITGSGLTAANYTFVQAATNATALTITPRVISVSGVSGITKTYDGTTALPAGGLAVSFNNVVNGDAVSVLAASGSYDSKNAGARSVTLSGLSLTGAAAGNYTLSGVTSVTGSGTITPAALLVSATATNRIYDGSTGASVVLAATPIGNDQVSVGFGSAAFADKNAGTGKLVTVNGLTLSGADAGNYTVASTVTTTATITPAALTVTASNRTKIYGDALDLGTSDFTSNGLVNGETIGSVVLTSAGTQGLANAGTYAVQAGSASGGTFSAANYAITYVNGQLLVNARPITVTADTLTKVYGDADPALTYQITAGNLVGTDAFSGALARTAGETVMGGPYAIGQGSLGLSSNYALTVVGGTMTITPRPITVTADALSMQGARTCRRSPSRSAAAGLRSPTRLAASSPVRLPPRPACRRRADSPIRSRKGRCWRRATMP